MKTLLSQEQVRILRAVARGAMTVNEKGRYVINGERRPARRERERLVKRGLIDTYPRPTQLTRTGRLVLEKRGK